MTKLRLGPIGDDKPVKATVEFPASVWRNLEIYADLLGKTTAQPIPDPAKLIVPMIDRFMATDRAFIKARRASIQPAKGGSPARSG